MAKISFDKGYVFTFAGGSGVVISVTKNTAVLITDEDMRTGPVVDRGEIPQDAVPAQLTRLPWGSQMAIRGALAAIGLPSELLDEE